MDDQEHNRLYMRGVALIEPEILLVGRRRPFWLTWWAKRRIRRGIQCLEEVLATNPTNWAALWFMGKGYQRLREGRQAYEAFRHAHEINPSQTDVLRELTAECLILGLGDEALGYAKLAVQNDATQPDLQANLAIALLIVGRVEEALREAEEALRRDPADRISANALQWINDVHAGRCERPSRMPLERVVN